jgi:diguanylate cyclase
VKRSVLSLRTGLLLAAAVLVPIALDQGVKALNAAGSDIAALALSDFGEAAWVAIAAAIVAYAAFRIGVSQQAGRNWLLIAIGMAMFAIGDLVYGIYEVVLQVESVPYPGLPDVLYLASYVFFAWALFSAALSYRKLVNVKVPLAVSIVVGVATLGIIYWFVLVPVLAAGSPAAETALNVAYPVFDVVLEFAPAVFILLVVLQLGGGRLAWPWFAVALGIGVIALADAGYSYLMATDAYVSGAVVDMGWSLGYGLLAVGASVARDVFDA